MMRINDVSPDPMEKTPRTHIGPQPRVKSLAQAGFKTKRTVMRQCPEGIKPYKML